MKIKKLLSLILSLVFVISMAVIPNGISASATADVEKPVIDISTLTVSKKNATVGDTVRFSIKITDNVKVSSAAINLKSPITQKTVYIGLKYDISSDRYIGDFAVTNTIEEGTWNISYIYARDSSDNSVNCYNRKYFSGSSNPDLSSYSFTVTKSNTDAVPPTEEVYDFEVALGETLNLSYKANCDIYWMSSDTSIAKIGKTSTSVISFGSYKEVSSSCEIIPVKEGIVTIYAADSNGYALNSAKVKVKKSETVTPEVPNKDITICSKTMIINNSTTLLNQTINKDLYIPKNVTLTLSGNVTVNGNIYVFGTLNNNGSLVVNGTLNCLWYGTMMSAGNYNYGYFNNNGSAKIETLNVRDDYLDYKISHNYGEWNVVKNPTETATGLKEHTCKNCGHTETEVIPKLDSHSNILGDVTGDGKINSNDALTVLRYSVDQITLTNAQFTAGDVNKDGRLNSNDALRILQYSVGQITEF